MGRLVPVAPSGLSAQPTPLVSIPQPGLSASVAGTTQINWTASYVPPPGLATYTFQFASSLAGLPAAPLIVQASPTYSQTGLTPGTAYWGRVNIQTSEAPSRTSTWSAVATVTTAPAVGSSLLSYIRGIVGTKVLSGQHSDYGSANALDQWSQIITATGQAPAIMGTILSRPGFSGDGVAISNAHLANGGIVFLSLFPGNPTTQATVFNTATAGPANFANLLVPGTTEYTRWQAYLAQLATDFKAINGTILLRPFVELNGKDAPQAFWWKNQNPATFVLVWKQMHDFMTAAGVTNLLWVFNVESENTNGQKPAPYFPGASYVDITSLDAYPPTAGDATTIADLAALGSMPIMYAEIGVSEPLPPIDSGDNGALLATIIANFPQIFAVCVWYRNQALPNQNGMAAFMANPEIINLAGLPTNSANPGVKYHGGYHYEWHGAAGWVGRGDNLSTQIADAQAHAGIPAWGGVKFEGRDAFYEGDTQGNISAVVTEINSLVTACRAVVPQQRIMMNTIDRVFGTPTGSVGDGGNNLYPAYMKSAGMIEAPSSGSGNSLVSITSWWNGPTMDAIIARWTALAPHYDTEPLVEMISPIGETAVSPAGGLSFSVGNAITQLERCMSALSAAWPHTLIRFPLNFLGNDAQNNGLIAYAAALPIKNICFGGPDPEIPTGSATYPINGPPPGNYPTNFRIIDGSFNFRGLLNAGANTGGTDSRPLLVYTGEVQSLGIDLAGRSMSTPAAICLNFKVQQNASYMCWDTATGNNATKTAIYNFVASQNVAPYGLNNTPPAGGTWNTGSGVNAFDFYISPTGSDSHPGTLASPWAITALNTKRSLYAGKKLGLISGTYNVYALIASSGATWNKPILGVNGGSASSPTYIASCDASGNYAPRTAILTADNGGAYPTTETGIIGQGAASGLAQTGNIILDGLYITRGFQHGISFFLGDPNAGNSTGQNGSDQGGASGIEIRNCEIFDIGGNDNDNVAGIYFNYCTAPWVHNTKIHSVQPTTGSQNPIDVAGIYSYYSIGQLYEYNTIYDCNQAIRDKFTPNGNQIYRYNYLELAGSAPQAGIQDGAGGLAGQQSQCYNNIIKCPGGDGWNANTVGTILSNAGLDFHNDTIIFGGAHTGLYWPGGGPGVTVKHYNNVYSGGGNPGFQGVLATVQGAISLSDYNVYGVPAGNFWTRSPTNAVGTPNSSLNFPAWQTAGFDPHSAQSAPSFVAAGALSPTGYRLVAGSPGSASGSTPGRIGGVVTGAATDMGAWGGVDVNTSAAPAQIGCGF